MHGPPRAGWRARHKARPGLACLHLASLPTPKQATNPDPQSHLPNRDWNEGELQSFLIEISAIILAKKDDMPGKSGYIIDRIVDKTGAKGTGE